MSKKKPNKDRRSFIQVMTVALILAFLLTAGVCGFLVYTSDDGLIKVVAFVPNGPADRQGELKVNDRIIAVTEENRDLLPHQIISLLQQNT